MLVARVGFVYEHRVFYLSSPLTILGTRDGGWNVTLAMRGTWAYAFYSNRVHTADGAVP